MREFLILLILSAIDAGVIKENATDCNGVVIDDIFYDREVLKSDIDRPYLLASDFSTNTLYFSYGINHEDDEFRTAKLNINTKDFHDIEGVTNGFAQTVDEDTHDVYIGGSDGIYKYDHKTEETKQILTNLDIWTIYFKDILYYSTYPTQILYTLSDGVVNRFKDLEDTKVDSFIIDNENYILFTNATGLFGLQIGSDDVDLYFEFTDGGVRGMNKDINGKVYVCFQDGVYAVKKAEKELTKVVSVDDAFGIVFDNDNNIIYSDANSLIKLKPNKDRTCADQIDEQN